MKDTTIVGMPPVARLPAQSGVVAELAAARSRIAEIEQTTALLRDLLREVSEARSAALLREQEIEAALAAATADAEAWRAAYEREHRIALATADNYAAESQRCLVLQRERDEARREFEMVLESRPVVMEMEP